MHLPRRAGADEDRLTDAEKWKTDQKPLSREFARVNANSKAGTKKSIRDDGPDGGQIELSTYTFKKSNGGEASLRSGS
jgi:hypothetical protein